MSYCSQTENLQGVREAHPNDLSRYLATTCDRGCDTTCDSRKGSYSGVNERDKAPMLISDKAQGRGAYGDFGTVETLRWSFRFFFHILTRLQMI